MVIKIPVITMMFFVPSMLFAEVSTFGNATTAAPAPAALMPTTDLMGMTLMMLLVVGVLLLASWLLKRSKLLSAPSQAGVKVIAQLPISVKEKLLVITVGGENLLVACAPGGISTLHVWTDDESKSSTVAPEKPFSGVLAMSRGDQSKQPVDGSVESSK